MDREKTIVVFAVALIAVVLIGGLVALLIFGFFVTPTVRTVITPVSSSGGRSAVVVGATAVPVSSPTTESNLVEVTRMVVTAAPSPTPAVCTPLPEDMTFTVTPTSDTAVTLELTGLQPGESLHFIFSWEGETGSSEIQLYDLPPVGSDCRFIDTIDLQQAESGTYTWQIKAIHDRGVACTEITLPEEETAVPIDFTAIQTGAPILFARDNDLWRADINGQNEQRLTEGGLLIDWGLDKLPAFDPWWVGGFPPQVHVSPDGRWLAFTQNGHNLVLVDVAGTEETRISPLSETALIFTWSPDSRQFVFGSNTLKSYDVATNSITNLINGYGRGIANPVWSPDGRFLAFACCFSSNTSSEPVPGKIRQLELATQEVTTVGETWLGIASGTPPVCWAADGTVGIDVAESIICSFDPQAMGHLPGDPRYAYFFIQSPDEDELFHWLGVKDRASDTILWEREVPFTQRVHWSPDGQWLFLGNDYYYIEQAAIYRLPADGSGEAEILLPDALLLDVIAAW